MISKTQIERRMERKENPEIVKTIILAKKNPAWVQLAQNLSGSTRRYDSVNLSEIDRNSKEGDTVIVIGRVLGTGEVSKKLRICALGFSESAKEKLKKGKSEMSHIADEIKKNPKAQGVKIIR